VRKGRNCFEWTLEIIFGLVRVQKSQLELLGKLSNLVNSKLYRMIENSSALLWSFSSNEMTEFLLTKRLQLSQKIVFSALPVCKHGSSMIYDHCWRISVLESMIAEFRSQQSMQLRHWPYGLWCQNRKHCCYWNYFFTATQSTIVIIINGNRVNGIGDLGIWGLTEQSWVSLEMQKD
jgi:hypothetical protein